MILGYHHTAIATLDLDRMLAFYRDQLGFTTVLEDGWKAGSARHDALTQLADSEARYAVLRLGATYLELFEFRSPRPRATGSDRPVSDPGLTHMAFAVDDIETEVARLSEAGVRFHCAPGPPGAMRAVYARDPEGNVFELIEFCDPGHPFAFRR